MDCALHLHEMSTEPSPGSERVLRETLLKGVRGPATVGQGKFQSALITGDHTEWSSHMPFGRRQISVCPELTNSNRSRMNRVTEKA